MSLIRDYIRVMDLREDVFRFYEYIRPSTQFPLVFVFLEMLSLS